MKINTSPTSTWEWDNGENLMLFSGNANGSRKATVNSKLKDEPKHDAGAGFLRVQSVSEDSNSSPGEIRTSDASTPDDQQQQSGVVTVAVPAGSGDSGAIGLKLGKRTYFEAVKAIPAATPSPSSCVPAAKKQRSAMQGTHMVPRCQVEGCKTELTAAKDYHRRHKVCELHSKSPKVIVNGIEQRFCQQCSRFHILSEFDEGKRSCRRRLAGHNERRRKPQPDSLAINPARFASAFYDDRRLNSILMDRSPFMHPRITSNSILEDSIDFKLGGYGKGAWPRVKAEDESSYDGQVSAGTLSRHNADRLLFLLQSSKTVPGGAINQDVHQYMQSSGAHAGQALTLSSSSGENLAGLDVVTATHGLSGVSDSGCALSLLSFQSGGSRASGSASFDMATRSGFTMDQLIQGDQPLMAQPLMQGVQHNFGLFAADKLLTVCSQSSTNLATGGFPATVVNSMDKQHQGGPLVSNAGGIGNFGGHVFGLLQGSSFRGSQAASSQDIHGTIDLMRRSSETQTNDSHDQPGMVHQGSRQFTDAQLLRSFESSIYDTHQLL